MNITGWNGSANSAGTGGRILFSDTATIDATELANISFAGFASGAILIDFAGNSAFNELVPVPEPSTWIGGALALLAVGWTQRRRFLRKSPVIG